MTKTSKGKAITAARTLLDLYFRTRAPSKSQWVLIVASLVTMSLVNRVAGPGLTPVKEFVAAAILLALLCTTGYRAYAIHTARRRGD